jgi:hypothetical protein
MRHGSVLVLASVALALSAGLMVPAAAKADEPYGLTVQVQFGLSSIHVGESTSLVITVTGQLPSSVAGSDGMAVSYYTPGGGADHGIVLSNGGGSCPYNYLFANQMAGEQAGPTIDCTITATVTGVSVGPHNTSVEADGLSFVGATFDGYSATVAANIAVVADPPSISAHFAQPTMAIGQIDTLSFEIDNPSGNGTLTGVGFTSTLPSGLTVGSSTSSVCGGTLTVASPHSISLTGASIDANSDCQVPLDVTGATMGAWGVTTSQVSSVEGGDGTAGSTSVMVVTFAPPTIKVEFGESSLQIGDTTSLTFTVTNPNAPVHNQVVKPALPDPHTLTGVGFTDTLPSRLVVADPNGLTGSCVGGTITASAGGHTISLSGASLTAGSTCTFSIIVDAVANGLAKNSTGPIESNEAGPGSSATATILVGNVPLTATTEGPADSGGNAELPLVISLMIGGLGAATMVVRRGQIRA